jgi:superfamily II DNA or RNA helicase
MIYVINSARYNLARHILTDINNGHSVLLIADECHRYGSRENNRIFDFYNVLENDTSYYALGLSATPEIADYRAISVPLGKEIYCYDLAKALHDRVISRFILFCVGISFTYSEREEYEMLSSSLAKCMLKLRKEYPELGSMLSENFFVQLQKIAKQGGEFASIARNALILMYKRRALSHMATQRIPCAISIVSSLSVHIRLILFCERISAAEQLFSQLLELYPNQVGLYHSNIPDNTRKEVLENYKRGIIRILICCKALDEGLNIPSTDAGIIVSTSKSARQRVQRMGRLLRRSNDIKRIYYLYIEQSSEDKEFVYGLNNMESIVPLVALRYKESTFFHSAYESLRKKVLEFVLERRHDLDLLHIIDQNINYALLRGDFLFSESVCRDNIKSSQSGLERNYWVSVLYVILARKEKLLILS